jgi:hypothetical protein
MKEEAIGKYDAKVGVASGAEVISNDLRRG